MRLQQAVWNADAHHEIGERLPFPIRTADDTGTVSLGVYAPPAKIRTNPLGRDRGEAVTRKSADLLEPLPRILFAFEALNALRFRLFGCNCHKKQKPTASFVYWRWADKC